MNNEYDEKLIRGGRGKSCFGSIYGKSSSEKISDQLWFWSNKWQQGEHKAEKDIMNGNIISFDDVHEAIKWLRRNEE